MESGAADGYLRKGLVCRGTTTEELGRLAQTVVAVCERTQHHFHPSTGEAEAGPGLW